MKMIKNADAASEYDRHVEKNNSDYKVKESRFYNLFARVLAVVAAFVLWMYVVQNDSVNYEKKIESVTVTVENVTSTPLSLITGGNTQIDVSVKGKRGSVVKLKSEDIHATVDVGNITVSGKYTLDVDVSLPDGISLVSLEPTAVTVYLDTTSTVNVPVKVVLQGYRLDDNYELGEPVPSVTEIAVSGPVSVLEKISAAQITLPYLDNLTNSSTVSDVPVLVDADGNAVSDLYIKANLASVNITVPVYETKTVPLTVDYKYGYFNSENASVTVMPSSITVKGDVAVIDAIENISVMTIDEKNVGTESVTRQIILPDGVTNISGEESATVKVEHIGTSLKNVAINSFKVINPNGLDYSLVTELMTVALRAPDNIISALKSEDITAEIELNFDKSTSGMVSVPVKIVISDKYSENVYEVGEYTATVNIAGQQ